MIYTFIRFVEVRIRVLLVLAFLLASFIHFFPHYIYADLASHFMPYYALSLIPALPIFLYVRAKSMLILWLITFSLFTYPVYTYLPISSLSSQSRKPTAQSIAMKVFMANVLTHNNAYSDFKKTLRAHNPDIAVLLEISSDWTTSLKEIEHNYTYVRYYPRQDNFGIGVLSKYPLISENLIPKESTSLPHIEATVRVGQTNVTVYGIHPVPPGGQDSLQMRNDLLREIATKAGRQDSAVIVTGDFNTTMWTPSYNDTLTRGRLVDPRAGRGFFPTWPTTTPFPLIPIDHILTSSDFKTLRFRTVPITGSDHLAVLSELVLFPDDPSAP